MKTFTLLYLPVVDALNSISQSRDDAAATASGLLASISRSEFVVAMVVLNHVLAVTKQLSVSLQEVNKDLVKCSAEIERQVKLPNTGYLIHFQHLYGHACKLKPKHHFGAHANNYTKEWSTGWNELPAV